MKIKNEGFEDLSVIGLGKHDLLLGNLGVVREDCAGFIANVWANDIILAFKASGYRVVRDASLPLGRIVAGNGFVPLKRSQCPDSCPDDTIGEEKGENITPNACSCKTYNNSSECLFEMRCEATQGSDTKWIYESPDNGKTVFRRPFGDYESKRELVRTSTYDKTTESIIR